MIGKILIAWCLVAVTVAIHSGGLAFILDRLWHLPARPHPRFWKVTWLTIRIAWWLILIHVIEITIWALVFWWQKCLPDAGSSFYFSGVTYTTVGYGDLVLPKEWRLFGPLRFNRYFDVWTFDSVLLCGSEQKIRDMVRKQSNLISHSALPWQPDQLRADNLLRAP